MWIDQVKRRRKNGNKTERSRKSLIRERYDEVCIYRGSATNQNVRIPHGADCLVIPNGAGLIEPRWPPLESSCRAAVGGAGGLFTKGLWLKSISKWLGTDVRQDKGQVRGLLGFPSSLTLGFLAIVMHGSHVIY